MEGLRLNSVAMNYPFMLSDSQWDEVKPYFDSKDRKGKQSLQVIVSGIITCSEQAVSGGCCHRKSIANGNWCTIIIGNG